MRIDEQLKDVETSCFVGRTEELEIMHSHATGNWKWQWLHIYGQGGIGKSTLLRRFRSELEGIPYFSLNGCRKKEDALEQLALQLRETGKFDLIDTDPEVIVERLNQLSYESGGSFVLLIDAFEEWRPVEEWLSQWLRKLKTTVRILTAGRYPLMGAWLRSGWASLIYSMALPALYPIEVEGYARKRGIIDMEMQFQLLRFSGGIPLAMTMATEVLLRGNNFKRFDGGDQTRLIAVLMEELIQGLPSFVQRLLEAASVLWRFNEDRLTSIVDDEIETETFRELVRLPFVYLAGDFWMLHDAVRTWTQEDLIRRKPQTYEHMRQKALEHIRSEERLNPHLRTILRMDKLYLHEHPLVRSTCFLGQADGVELRECRECDIPAIQSLYIRYLDFISPSVPEERHMEGIIRPIWQTDPSSFITIWRQNVLIAFYGMFPLHDRLLSVLANEPLFHPFIQGWKPAPKAYLSCMVGLEPELETSARAFILNAMFDHYSIAERILTLTCLKEWFPLFELCGFARVSWADTITAHGTEYRAFSLDLSQEDFQTKLDRLLTKHPSEEISVQSEPSRDMNELKRLLKNLHNLPRNPEKAQSYGRLFPHRLNADGSNNSSGLAAQQDLLHAIHLLSTGNDREAVWGKLLNYIYIQGIRPHERVADRLNLSMATYYRHLNKALEQLYELLVGE